MTANKMMTVNEVSKLTGVSIRTLQYYNKINLLLPTEYTEAGYRLYDDAALETLQQILLFRELEFPLKEIKQIISSPNFDKAKALQQQIELLSLKKEHLNNLISFAREIQKSDATELQIIGSDAPKTNKEKKGMSKMDFKAFDKSKMEEYSKRAKEQWGDTVEYKEFEEKHGSRSEEQTLAVNKEFMKLFEEFGQIMNSTCRETDSLESTNPSGEAAQAQVKKLQNYISEHFYECSKEILAGLGQMYEAGGEFTENIDAAGGKGTAAFAAEAIRVYCK